MADFFSSLTRVMYTIAFLLFAFSLALGLAKERLLIPITDAPNAPKWEPVVNSIEANGDPVPGVYVVTMPNGDSCYLAYGTLVDSFSCVGN